MKILSLLMMSLFLHAQNIEIQVAKDLEIGWDEELDSVEFVYKSDLGRAAVEVTFVEDDGEDYWYRTDRVLLDGLFFNQEKKAVVYNGVVCAEVKKRFKVFSYLKETGNCVFNVEEHEIEIDNGWDVKTKNVVSVTLTILQ